MIRVPVAELGCGVMDSTVVMTEPLLLGLCEPKEAPVVVDDVEGETVSKLLLAPAVVSQIPNAGLHPAPQLILSYPLRGIGLVIHATKYHCACHS